MALVKYFQPEKIYNVPDFCSLIRFELWTLPIIDNETKSNNLLRIYYDSIILKEIIY